MRLSFRPAQRGDVAAIVDLMLDDDLGATRENRDLAPYLAAFDRMADEPHNQIVIGVDPDGTVVATYQLTFIQGLSHQATRRAQVESVRIAAGLRGLGLGTQMMQDAEARAQTAGCRLMQLTTHASRNRARDFYDRLGYTPSHVGYKHVLQ